MDVIKETRNLNADVVVIGGGGSGMVAAVAAAENNVKNIVILEKAAHLGGNAYLAGGMFAVESPAQQRLGIKTSKDQVFKEAMDISRWGVNPKIVRAYINKSGKIIEWFESKGMKFEVKNISPEWDSALGHVFSERQGRYASKPIKVAQGPGFVGSTVIDTMYKDCKKYGVNILTKTKAEKIVLDAAGGVSGVLASSKERKYKISTKSIILAAGDFGANKEMMEKYFNINILGDVFKHQVPGMTGDGILMAKDAGAAIDHHPAIHWFGPCHHKWASSVHYALQRPDMLWVNKNGERFVDESYSNGPMGNVEALHRQPGQICYALLDSKTVKNLKATPSNESADFDKKHMYTTLSDDLGREATEGKKAWKANTIYKLADLIGAKQEVLKATVERYNSFCDTSYDEDFIKDSKYLRPINIPPYYAILGVIGWGYTSGGIKISEKMEVVNNQSEIIRGLYATGNNAGDWITNNYAHGGTSLSFAFCSGYIAGENAAKYVLGK